MQFGGVFDDRRRAWLRCRQVLCGLQFSHRCRRWSKLASRFVSFLDVLGFSDLVNKSELDEVKKKLEAAVSAMPYGLALGEWPRGSGNIANIAARQPQLRFSAFSDTYMIWSEDASIACFFEIVVATALVTGCLFSVGLGVRGAITSGEAECILGTSQLVGRAVTRAASLEKQQEWFGVVFDPEILSPDRRAVLDLLIVKPLIVQYDVPLKDNATLKNPCVAVNWRFNMTVEKGIASLLRTSQNPQDEKKRTATLQFCRWLRDRNLAYGKIFGPDGTRIKIPWLAGMHVGEHAPGTSGAVHGDEF